MSVVVAAVVGDAWGRNVGSAVAMDWHGQVVFAEGNDAATKPADGPLAPPAFLELEADKDAQPEDQFADLGVRLLVLRQCRQVVDRHHQGVYLFLGAQVGLGDRLWHRVFSHLPCDCGLFRHEAVKRLGDGLVAGFVLLGGHPPLGGRRIVLEFGQPFPQVHKGGGLLGHGVFFSFGASLRQKPLANKVTSTGLVDQFHKSVDEHGREWDGLDRVVIALGVSAVVIAAAGVLQFVPDGDAVHNAAAALRQVDDPRGQRVAVGIVRLPTVFSAKLFERRLLRLQGLPTVQIEVGFAAATSTHPDLLRIFDKLRLAVRATIMLFEFPGATNAHAAISTLGPFAVLLNAGDEWVGAEVVDRIRMPLAGHAVRRTVVATDSPGVGRRDAHLIESSGDLLAAVAGGPPFEDHAPDADLHLVAREEADVMAAATDVLAVLEPLHERVVGAHECPAKSVGSPAAGAQPACRHALLDEHDPITEPRRKFSMPVILDDAAD